MARYLRSRHVKFDRYSARAQRITRQKDNNYLEQNHFHLSPQTHELKNNVPQMTHRQCKMLHEHHLTLYLHKARGGEDATR